jgi:hypothetical protein
MVMHIDTDMDIDVDTDINMNMNTNMDTDMYAYTYTDTDKDMIRSLDIDHRIIRLWTIGPNFLLVIGLLENRKLSDWRLGKSIRLQICIGFKPQTTDYRISDIKRIISCPAVLTSHNR